MLLECLCPQRGQDWICTCESRQQGLKTVHRLSFKEEQELQLSSKSIHSHVTKVHVKRNKIEKCNNQLNGLYHSISLSCYSRSVSQVTHCVWVAVMVAEHHVRGDERACITLDKQASKFLFSQSWPIHTVELCEPPPVSLMTQILPFKLRSKGGQVHLSQICTCIYDHFKLLGI